MTDWKQWFKEHKYTADYNTDGNRGLISLNTEMMYQAFRARMKAEDSEYSNPDNRTQEDLLRSDCTQSFPSRIDIKKSLEAIDSAGWGRLSNKGRVIIRNTLKEVLKMLEGTK